MPTAFKHKDLIKPISRTAIVTAGITARVWMLVIPLPDHNDLAMYGKDVMDFTIFGLRSI
jgi:hypothetical protein